MRFNISEQESWWDQENLIKVLIGISLLVHIMLFVFGNNFRLFSPRNFTEIAIEADLVTEADLKPASKTVIPQAKEAETPAVPSNLLPQVNKDFAIKKKQREEEGMIPDKDAETAEIGSEVKPEQSELDSTLQDDSRATQLAKLEALKRIAMEKLRKEQKEKSNELRAHEDDKLAQVKEALHKEAGLSKDIGGGLLSQAAGRMYVSYLYRSIRKNWALPKTFQLIRSDMKASLDISINARGELVSVKINKGSGDSTFDQYCVDAVKNSSPFKAPPQARVGEAITINCIP